MKTLAPIRFGATADTNLYRLSSNVLKTDGDLVIGGNLTIVEATNTTLWLSSTTDPTVQAGGIKFGVSRDTNLYRSAVNTLKTDGKFVVGASLVVTGNIAFNGVTTAPVQSTGWAVTPGYTVTKTFNPEAATLTSLARTVGTLIDYLKARGDLG